MGLAERRAAKEFREQRFPALEADMRAAAGFDLAHLAKLLEQHL